MKNMQESKTGLLFGSVSSRIVANREMPAGWGMPRPSMEMMEPPRDPGSKTGFFKVLDVAAAKEKSEAKNFSLFRAFMSGHRG